MIKDKLSMGDLTQKWICIKENQDTNITIEELLVETQDNIEIDHLG